MQEQQRIWHKIALNLVKDEICSSSYRVGVMLKHVGLRAQASTLARTGPRLGM